MVAPSAMGATTEVVAEPAEFLEEEVDEADFQTTPGVGAPMGSGLQAAVEWAPSVERPVIRPPVATNPALRGRTPGTMSRANGGGNELGVEESEFDRPTFIRRGITPPG